MLYLHSARVSLLQHRVLQFHVAVDQLVRLHEGHALEQLLRIVPDGLQVESLELVPAHQLEQVRAQDLGHDALVAC